MLDFLIPGAVISVEGAPADEPEMAATASRRPTVLLASRDGAVRKWGTRWLETAGLVPVAVSDGDEALARIVDGCPDLTVVDSALRVTGTDDPLSRFRELLGDGAPLIALCGGKRELHHALEVGVTDIARKPIDWQVLSRRTALLARLSAAARELDDAHAELAAARERAHRERDARERWAAHDRLTELPNRRRFEGLLEKALTAGDRGRPALFFIDLDRFKAVNAILGRRAGDDILRQVAGRLRACLRSAELMARRGSGLMTGALARLSGDEFIVMLSGVEEATTATALGEVLLDALGKPFSVEERSLYLTASLGIAMFPLHGESAEELVQSAEMAMKDAKRLGGGLCRTYNPSLDAAAERELEVEGMLRQAFARDELEVYYQPLVDSSAERVVGAEALLRWHHPQLGWIRPLEFIPVAEQVGLMAQIDTWVLETACAQLRAWLDAGLPPLRMAVNVSLCQLVRGNLATLVERVLERTGIPPHLLELELSERGVLRSDPDILAQLEALKRLGVRLSADDFGSGNSAIAYLKRFPLDCLKIDLSYVGGICSSASDAAITSAIIAMAQRLDLEVIAEGVEDEEQLAHLTSWGCHEYQGFLFSPAVPASDFSALIERHLEPTAPASETSS